MSDALGYYRLLEVSEDADIAVIKSSYRDLAKFWHPDRNTAPEAMEKFQKLSEAWEVLENEDRRRQYDLLSLVYNAANYPDLENIRPYVEGNPDIRALNLHEVRGWLWKYKANTVLNVYGYKPALAARCKNAALNWLLGWWHPQAFIKNIQALSADWRQPISESESLRVLVHNIVAYQLLNRPQLAVACAVNALAYADASGQELLQNFIRRQNLRVAKPKAWNLLGLKLVQLVVPFLLVLAALLPVGSGYVTESELWNWFGKKQEIDYYQEVNFGARGQSVDDVVVGKILNIPVDKNDVSKLYHLKSQTKVMYAPGDDFDVLKEMPAKTTVRLTGRSPDGIWSRIMIDNGEMGFVRTDGLIQGIGAEIPYGSQIFQK